MGIWPWQCTPTGLDNSTELRMEKIHQACTEIWVPQVWQPAARPPARTVTTIPLQPGGLRGKTFPQIPKLCIQENAFWCSHSVEASNVSNKRDLRKKFEQSHINLSHSCTMSHDEIPIRFCCIYITNVSGFIWFVSPYFLALLHWHRGNVQHWIIQGFNSILTHCGLVTSYGDRDLGKHWLR